MFEVKNDRKILAPQPIHNDVKLDSGTLGNLTFTLKFFECLNCPINGPSLISCRSQLLLIKKRAIFVSFITIGRNWLIT